MSLADCVSSGGTDMCNKDMTRTPFMEIIDGLSACVETIRSNNNLLNNSINGLGGPSPDPSGKELEQPGDNVIGKLRFLLNQLQVEATDYSSACSRLSNLI